MKPLFGWVGAKNWLWKRIKDILIEDKHDTYIEPFLGGGAIAWNLMKYCDEQLSLDIMQETFIKLMSNIENYFDDGRLKQYIAMIATNISKNELKKRENQNTQLDEDRGHPYSYNDNSKVEIMVTLEKCLSSEELDVVSLKVLFDYTFKEIAEELNTTIGSVQSTYYRAMEILKKYFQSETKGE